MKQKGVTKEALGFVKNGYQSLLDGQMIRPKEAFKMKASELKDINISGRTLRKIFKGDSVSIDTITNSIEQFGKKWILKNGEIDIDNENSNNN